jgi:iron uptake system component EfeO
VENVGPGLSRDLVINVPAGRYVPACKPGMVGKGIRTDFTVTGSGQSAVAGASQQQIATANAQYKAYVRDQTDQLLSGTRRFVAAYKAGDDAEARALYAPTRVHWERIEPVAESFGDLDPRMDLREADLEQGQGWTGWHRIEKDLWPPRNEPYTALTKQRRATYADRLLADTVTLQARVQRLSFSVDQIGNGAKGLLDEVAKSKVTGEEEAWSHTDLYDFQANVDGARVAFEGLKPVLTEKDPALERQIERRFADLQGLLDRHRTGGGGFVSYTALSTPQVKALSDAVNALSEPLSKLTAAVAL